MVAGDRFRPEVLATVRDPTGSPVTMYWATTVLRTQVSRSPRTFHDAILFHFQPYKLIRTRGFVKR